MAQSFTRVTRQSWRQRFSGSIAGVIAGVVMTLASFPVLFLNEGRAVKRYQTLKEGAGVVMSVEAGRIDPNHEGRLVHVSGKAEVSENVADPQFGQEAEALRLRRGVQMYQWVEEERSETRQKTGGGTERVTTYTYKKEWSSSLHPSSRFAEPAGRRNPDQMPFEAAEFTASEVTLGAFKLPSFLVAKIGGYEPLPADSLDGVPEELRQRLQPHGGGLYLGANPAAPAVGDARINFSIVPPKDVSVVAAQTGNTFSRYRTAAGGDLDLLQVGVKSPEEMFAAAETANKMLTWGLRLGGFLLMSLGLGLMARPLRVVADVLPLAGRIVGAGLGFVTLALAGVGSSAAIAAAWIFYRPVMGVAVLVVTGVIGFYLIKRLRRGKAKPEEWSAQPDAEPDAPPPL